MLVQNLGGIVRRRSHSSWRRLSSQAVKPAEPRVISAFLVALDEKSLPRWPYPPMVAEVTFIDRRLYESPIARGGYSIEDVINQTASGRDAAAFVFSTALPSRGTTRIALPFSFALMPLSEEAPALIRANLEQLQIGNRVRLVAIGTLTATQLGAINAERRACGYPPMVAEVVFIGRHVYESRIVRDGYSIEDVIDQIASGMDAAAVVFPTASMTAMENSAPRIDRCGNTIRDRVIFECSTRHPRPELFSVVPKGDSIKPKRPPTK